VDDDGKQLPDEIESMGKLAEAEAQALGHQSKAKLRPSMSRFAEQLVRRSCGDARVRLI
jgi:hypothetical protein